MCKYYSHLRFERCGCCIARDNLPTQELRLLHTYFCGRCDAVKAKLKSKAHPNPNATMKLRSENRDSMCSLREFVYKRKVVNAICPNCEAWREDMDDKWEALLADAPIQRYERLEARRVREVYFVRGRKDIFRETNAYLKKHFATVQKMFVRDILQRAPHGDVKSQNDKPDIVFRWGTVGRKVNKDPTSAQDYLDELALANNM